MDKNLTRRDFLKQSFFLSAGAFLFTGKSSGGFSRLLQTATNSTQLGRVLVDGVKSYASPAESGEVLQTYTFNDLVEYEQEIKTESAKPHAELWFKLKDGSFIPSRGLQPVQNALNEPVTNIDTAGQLAEVTVPFTNAIVNQRQSKRNNASNQMFFYGSTHWIYGLGKDEKGILYYLVKEDRWEDTYYVNAAHLRLIPDSELAPTSTAMDQDKKVIRISLREQYLIAYENEQPVFMSALSSGQLVGNVDLTTPTGDYVVNYKRPSRHMVHTDRTGTNDDELYGVPWVSYFTESGIAFHGTYWHNDFTKPNSHGCINLPIPAARWIYLWTQPVVAPKAMTRYAAGGTRVEVF